MCILFLKYSPCGSEGYKLILASNRDEYYDRPTTPAQFWPNNPSILGGFDEVKGGTWLGVTKSGKFAILTNYYEYYPTRTCRTKSRGSLVVEYLRNSCTPSEYCQTISGCKSDEYHGYNILLGQLSSGHEGANDDLMFYANRGMNKSMSLTEGIYGLGNTSLNEPWLKVDEGKKKFASIVSEPTADKEFLTTELMDMLNNSFYYYPDPNMEHIGYSDEWMKAFSSIFAKKEESNFGTRTNTIVLVDCKGNVSYTERTMDKKPIDGRNPTWNTSHIEFMIQ